MFKDPFGLVYNVVFALLIVIFTYFYTAITVPTNKMADDLKRSGGFIPGIKPGAETGDFLDKLMSLITFPGSLFLALIAVFPAIIDGLDVTQLHVFSYSERPGTQALKIEYVVSPEEKHQRSQRLLTLSDQKTQAFYARHIGQVMPVLMEKSKTGVPMHGFTENYIRVEVENDDSLDNRVVNVRLGDFNEERTALKSTILI
jgi:hypothetical protein